MTPLEATNSLFHGWPFYQRRRSVKRPTTDQQEDSKKVKCTSLNSEESKQSLHSAEFVITDSVAHSSIAHSSKSILGTKPLQQSILVSNNDFTLKADNERLKAKKRTVKVVHIKQEKVSKDDSDLIKIEVPAPTDLPVKETKRKTDDPPVVTTIPIEGKEFLASVLATCEESSCLEEDNEKINSASTFSNDSSSQDKVIQLSKDHTYFEFKSPKKKVILKITKNPERPTERIKSLEELLNILVKENLLKADARCVLEAFLDLPNGLIRNRSQNSTAYRPNAKYSQAVVKFACTVYFYSPCAFEYISKIFMLPKIADIRDKVKVLNYFPGISQEALSILKNGFSNASHQMKLCSIMIVNVKIKEQCDYDVDFRRYIGHVDFGGGQNPEDSDEVPKASDALLLVAVGLASNWKLPFGYILNSNLCGEFLQTLVSEAIVALEDCNLEVRALVCDGYGPFLTLGSLLGCKVNVKSFRDMEVSFPHPTVTDRRVVFVYDANYGLQLLKNLLADKEALQSTTYGKIEWKFLKMVFDGSDCDILAGKEMRDDMEFYRQTMKLKLGAHSLGNSVGKTLELLEHYTMEEFAGYDFTANFAADIDRAFDTLNSRNPVAPGERSPMFQYTVEEQRESLTFVARRIIGLELLSGKRIIDEGRRMSVIVFAFTLKAFCRLACDLVHKNIVRYLCTYRLNLQHTEVILSSLKKIGKWHSEPSAAEFKDAYRKLLRNSQILLKSNGLFTDDFEGEDLTVSQGIIYPRRNFRSEQLLDLNVVLSKTCGVDCGSELFYVARHIARHIANKLTCSECIEILLGDMPGSIFMHSKIYGIQFISSAFVKKLIKLSDRVLKIHSNSEQTEKLVSLVFSEFAFCNLNLGIKANSLLHYIEEPYHVICLSKVVIRTYFLLRSSSVSKF